MFGIGIFLPKFNAVVLVVCFASREGVRRGREREGEQNEDVLFLHIASFIKKVGSQGNLLLTFGQEGRRKRREEGKEWRKRGRGEGGGEGSGGFLELAITAQEPSRSASFHYRGRLDDSVLPLIYSIQASPSVIRHYVQM